jgi:hypothetical protein
MLYVDLLVSREPFLSCECDVLSSLHRECAPECLIANYNYLQLFRPFLDTHLHKLSPKDE